MNVTSNRTAQTRAVHPHGTRQRYRSGPDENDQPGKGCRCASCRKANTRAANQHRLAVARGRRSGLVDVKPVRTHLRQLMGAGVSYPRIAELSGISRDTINRLLYNASVSKVRAATARALYAVSIGAPPSAGKAWVPAVGTARRAGALVAVGWPARQIAARLGVSNPTMLTILHSGPHQRIRAATAVRMAAVYDELWNADPVTSGVSAASSRQAREFARRNQWPPPGAWDDDTIDHPDGRFDMGAKVKRGVALVEDCEELVRQGFTVEQAAQRLGVEYLTLRQARSRAAQREQVSA